MATWTNDTKSSTTFANVSKNTSTYVNETMNSASESYLLQENGDIFLLESGYYLLLESSTGGWTNITKN